MKKMMLLVFCLVVCQAALAAVVPSPSVFLMVHTPPNLDSSPPATVTRFVGQTLNLGVVVSGTGPFVYKWQKEGADIVGANSATYGIASVALTDAGNYKCVVTSTGSGISRESAVCNLVIYDQLRFTTQPWTALSKTVGQPFDFSVVATGQGTVSYQWKKDGVAVTGATSANYSVTSATLGDAGTYTCVASDGINTPIESTPGVLTVLPAATVPATFTVTHNAGEAVYSVVFNAHGAALASILSNPGVLPQGTSYSNITAIGIYCKLSSAPWTVLEVKNVTVTQDGDTTILTFTGSGVDWGNQPTTVVVDSSTFFVNFFFQTNNCSDRLFVNPDYVEAGASGTAAQVTKATSDGNVMWQVDFSILP